MSRYSFQYANKRTVREDKDPITLEEAQELWKKYIPQFKSDMENNLDPEMCIWKDESDTSYFNYETDIQSWHSENLKLIDGQLWQCIG
jgi:hypothetical protein